MSYRQDGARSTRMRAAKIGETEQFLEIFCAAFRLDRDAARPLFYRDPFFDLNLKRVCIIDPFPPEDEPVSPCPRDSASNDGPGSCIASCLTLIPTKLQVGAGCVSMAGIAGVATRPEHRRRGYAGALIVDTLRKASHELGFPLAGLYPVDTGYYARFGFVQAATSMVWTARREDLPSHPPTAVRPLDPRSLSDLAGVAAVHVEATRGRTCACRRGASRWRVIHELMVGRHSVVVESSGSILGYAHLQVDEPSAERRLTVHEMHALDDCGAKALLGYLAGHDNIDTVVWHTSPADLNSFGVRGLGSTAVEPDAMLRITDVRAAFDAVHHANYAAVLADGSKSLTVIARDAANPENEAPVTLDSAGVHVGRIGTHAVAADIGALTQIYVGYLTPAQAHSAGSLHASDAASLALAEKLFPALNPQIPALDRF